MRAETELPARTFGAAPGEVASRPRHAAYAVIVDGEGHVAAVRGRGGRFWLPGGGSLAGETPEETVLREIREELGREARPGDRIARATQHFHAADEGCWYEMAAVFVLAELVGDVIHPAEDEMSWLDPARDAALFFHPCHAWAAEMGVAR
ncbi:MAG TPA: NUDIX domain-containing protein [Longimicrobium sp.]